MTDTPSTNLPVYPPWCKSPAGHPYTNEPSATPETAAGTAVKAGYVNRYHEDALDLGEVIPVARPMSFSGLKESPISAGIDCEEQAIDYNSPAVQSAPEAL